MQIKDIVTTKPIVLFDDRSMIRLTDDVRENIMTSQWSVFGSTMMSVMCLLKEI